MDGNITWKDDWGALDEELEATCGYNRAEVALRAAALSLSPPDNKALAWVWDTFTFKLCTLTCGDGPPTDIRRFERALLSRLAEAWGMVDHEFDTRCQRAYRSSSSHE